MIEKVVVTEESEGSWRLIAYAANGKPIVETVEGYKNREWAIEVAHRVFPEVAMKNRIVDEDGDTIPHPDLPRENEQDVATGLPSSPGARPDRGRAARR